MPDGHPIIVLKSNKFNMAAVSVKRSIGKDRNVMVNLVPGARLPMGAASVTFWSPVQMHNL